MKFILIDNITTEEFLDSEMSNFAWTDKAKDLREAVDIIYGYNPLFVVGKPIFDYSISDGICDISFNLGTEQMFNHFIAKYKRKTGMNVALYVFNELLHGRLVHLYTDE